MSKEKDVPYWRVLNMLLDRVRDGTYPPGGRIPPERWLAETERVSRSTVSRALEKLRWIGLIVGPGGGNARVAQEPRRSAALRLVDEAARIRSMDDGPTAGSDDSAPTGGPTRSG